MIYGISTFRTLQQTEICRPKKLGLSAEDAALDEVPGRVQPDREQIGRAHV